jgi:ParB-like chromosome segregation protein Spo0J
VTDVHDAPYQILPPLTEEEEAALEKSIAENGVLNPIVADENGVIIDGHHRQRIATRLGKTCPRRTVRDLTEEQKVAMALTLNVDRRHLTREQKRELLAKSIKAEPELSDREHGRRTGTTNKTVAKVRGELEGREEIPHAEERTDSAGRKQPATKPVGAKPYQERRKSLPDAYNKARDDLDRLLHRFEKLHQDDRFTKNRNIIREGTGTPWGSTTTGWTRSSTT